jgi:hypothetical protein
MFLSSLTKLAAVTILLSPITAFAQGGGSAGGSSGGASAGGAASGPTAGTSAVGSPNAGSAGAGTAATSGVPSGPANVECLNNDGRWERASPHRRHRTRTENQGRRGHRCGKQIAGQEAQEHLQGMLKRAAAQEVLS